MISDHDVNFSQSTHHVVIVNVSDLDETTVRRRAAVSNDGNLNSAAFRSHILTQQHLDSQAHDSLNSGLRERDSVRDCNLSE